MSRNGPAPQRLLHRPGNAVSRDRQTRPKLQQGFATTVLGREFPDQGDSSCDSSLSHVRHGGERAVDGDGRRPHFTVQQPAPGSPSELGLPQHLRNSARLNPMDARAALVDRGTTSVSKLSHLACLIPGYRAIPQEAHQTRGQDFYASGFPSASARISDAETPSLVTTTVQLFQQALPPGFNAGTDFSGFGRDSNASTATAGGTTPAQRRPRCGPTSEDYPSIPSTQGTGSRHSAETRPVPADQRKNSRADTEQDGTLGVLTSEEDGAMWGKVVLRGGGYRLHGAQHHPEISQVATSAGQRVTVAIDIPEDVIRHGRRARGRRDDSARIEQRIPEPTASVDSPSIYSISSSPPPLFSPPSPPPRVSCDLVARNAFLAANIFHFEPENVGGEDIIDNREESAAVDRQGGAEACARRASLRWGEELVDKLRFEIRRLGSEEVREG